MKVDENDVPLLIQNISYRAGNMSFIVTYFNGVMNEFLSENVCPSAGLMDFNLTRMQWLEAENNITKQTLQAWAK